MRRRFLADRLHDQISPEMEEVHLVGHTAEIPAPTRDDAFVCGPGAAHPMGAAAKTFCAIHFLCIKAITLDGAFYPELLGAEMFDFPTTVRSNIWLHALASALSFSDPPRRVA